MKSKSSKKKPIDNSSLHKICKKKELQRKLHKRQEKLLERRRKLRLKKPISKLQAPNLNCNKHKTPLNKFLNKKK
jgi:hypothetical protein